MPCSVGVLSQNIQFSSCKLVNMKEGALAQWLKQPAWKVGDRGFKPCSGLQIAKKQNVSFPLIHKDSILWGPSWPRGRCFASDRQGSNFERCIWRAMSAHLSHYPQEVLMAQFSLYVHKGGLKIPVISCLWMWPLRNALRSKCHHKRPLSPIPGFIEQSDQKLNNIYIHLLLFSRRCHDYFPESKPRKRAVCPNVDLMLVHRRRRWTSIKSTLRPFFFAVSAVFSK